MRKLIVITLILFCGCNESDLNSHSVSNISYNENKKKKIQNLTYDQIMAYLDSAFTMEKSTPVDGKQRYMGQTTDNLAMLEIIGDKHNVSQTTLIVGLPSDAPNIVIRNSALICRFLLNVAPDWKNSEDWLNNSLEQVSNSPESHPIVIINNKEISLKLLEPLSMILVTVKQKQ